MSSSSGRLLVQENKDYQKSGLKSYAWLLAKYSIVPTQEGPFYRSALPSDAGQTAVQGLSHQRFLHAGQHPVGHLMKRAATATESGGQHVTTEDVQNDSLYLSEVEIGNPPQKFLLDFDTGSSDLWVFDKKISKRFPNNNEHHFFDSSKSTTFNLIREAQFEIHFGDGSFAAGIVGQDDLKVGGITVEQQVVEPAEDLDKSFISGKGDGLLGLGFGTINSVTTNNGKKLEVKTPVENMIAQKDIPKDSQLFTCKLGSWRDREETDKGESFYTFGFIDRDTVKATGEDIHYAPVDRSNGWWQFESATATVNGKRIDRPTKRHHKHSQEKTSHPPPNTAIADTGTTLALIDDHTLGVIYAAIPGARFDKQQQGWVYPAETKEAQFPVVTLAVGERQFVIQKEDLGFEGFKDQQGKEWVYGGIQSRGNMTFDILGDTFLKGIYAIFDMTNEEHPRFGAVQRKELRQNISVPEG